MPAPISASANGFAEHIAMPILWPLVAPTLWRRRIVTELARAVARPDRGFHPGHPRDDTAPALSSRSTIAFTCGATLLRSGIIPICHPRLVPFWRCEQAPARENESPGAGHVSEELSDQGPAGSYQQPHVSRESAVARPIHPRPRGGYRRDCPRLRPKTGPATPSRPRQTSSELGSGTVQRVRSVGDAIRGLDTSPPTPRS